MPLPIEPLVQPATPAKSYGYVRLQTLMLQWINPADPCTGVARIQRYDGDVDATVDPVTYRMDDVFALVESTTISDTSKALLAAELAKPEPKLKAILDAVVVEIVVCAKTDGVI